MDHQTETAWEDLGPTPRSPSFAQRRLPSGKTLEIAGKLGLRFPPANTVDREAHAARVALLAEDCADIEPDLFHAAASEWSRRERFFPKACELRELAKSIAIVSARPMIEGPKREERSRPYAPPLTDREIATLPEYLIEMGIKVGEFTREKAEQLRAQHRDAA